MKEVMVARDLKTVPFDPEFRPGAKSAVFTCLRVSRGERVVLITDEESLPIGASLFEQFTAAGASLEAFVLEDFAPRPLSEFPAVIADAMRTAQVSCFAGVIGYRLLSPSLRPCRSSCTIFASASR